MTQHQCAHRPSRILVLGGGRWARVIVGVLTDLLAEDVSITACSPRGADALTSWVRRKGLVDRVQVLDERPQRLNANDTAVIVANAARDHVASGLWALNQGCAALIEKPFARDCLGTQRLIAAARQRQVPVAAAHVFRFAGYLDVLAERIAAIGDRKTLEIRWSDATAEERYGEQKGYDPAVPVFQDCLPHVVSVIQTVTGVMPKGVTALSVRRGGAQVEMGLDIGAGDCRVFLERHAPVRQRAILVDSADGTVHLDFAKEPGLITLNGVALCADDHWNNRPRPLASLLSAFLEAAAGGRWDQRLSTDTALAVCALVEAADKKYEAALLPWLAASLRQGKPELAEECWAVRYALTELCALDGYRSADVAQERVETLMKTLAGRDPPEILQELRQMRKMAQAGLYRGGQAADVTGAAAPSDRLGIASGD